MDGRLWVTVEKWCVKVGEGGLRLVVSRVAMSKAWRDAWKLERKL